MMKTELRVQKIHPSPAAIRQTPSSESALEFDLFRQI